MKIIRHVAVSCVLCGLATTAQAGVIFNGSAELQVEAWLGLGDLQFTELFDKTSESNGDTWHAAVDGKGPTITLLEAVAVGVVGSDGFAPREAAIIGGFNPQSWMGVGDYVLTPDDADRTGFVFNLTTGELRRQKLGTAFSSAGVFQTLDYPGLGPTFGGGWDLTVNGDLFGGSEKAFSYGPANPQNGDDGLLALDNNSCGINCRYTAFLVGRLETYTFARPVPVPEPSSLLLLGAGLAGFVGLRRSA